MPSANPVVYNQASLQSWKEELEPLRLRISETSRFIEEQTQLLRPYQSQLNSVDSLISITQSQLAAANINATQDRIYHMQNHHHHHEGVLHYMGDMMQSTNISRLEKELENLYAQLTAIQNQMQPYERVINEARANLNRFHSREAFLKQHIPAAESFLQTLNENPFQLVTLLTNKLQKAFADYEDTHFMDLSAQARISLIAVRYGLNQLIVYDKGFNPEVALQSTHQINYLRLCGFIWDMYQKVKQEDKDEQFEKILAELVESMHVLQDGDLPDHLRTGYTASALFEEYKRAIPGYFSIQAIELPNIEEQIFNNGFTIITQNQIPQPTFLQKHIINTTNLIDAEIKMKKQKQEAIDYYFYGRMVRVLNDVLVNPADQQAAKRLNDIAAYASGHPSVGKQVLGGLLIVLGILLIGASVAGFITTFGSSSLLSAWGMAIGLSLFQAQVVCGVASSLAMTTGLGVTFFAGPKTVNAGQRQGLSQELIHVKEDVESYDETQSHKIQKNSR